MKRFRITPHPHISSNNHYIVSISTVLRNKYITADIIIKEFPQPAVSKQRAFSMLKNKEERNMTPDELATKVYDKMSEINHMEQEHIHKAGKQIRWRTCLY